MPKQSETKNSRSGVKDYLKNPKVKLFLVALLIFLAFLLGVKLVGKEGKKNGAEVISEATPTPTKIEYPRTLGDFLITDREICLEKSKPLVYYFGSSSCPHCLWESPIVKRVTDKFKNLIAFHNNMDNQKDMEVFNKYAEINPGYIPFLVFGCKYVRVGAGEKLAADIKEAEKLEEEALTAILCKLTDNKPTLVCNPLKEKVSGIQ